MKALCAEVSEDRAVLICSGQTPDAGRYYTLEDAVDGTGAQNRAFHALVQEYWRSGAHSYNAGSFREFRDLIKRDLGAGFEAWVYVDPQADMPRIQVAQKYEDIPETLRGRANRKDYIRGRLKSWADYTKKQRKETIDRLIAEMDQAGVNSRKYQEILEGMNDG